jgi:hypothetical protein
MSDYPMDAADLSRRLLGRELIPPGDGHRGDYDFVQGEVRRLLTEFGCPRASGSYRPRYLVDEEVARRVARELGRTLH